MTNEPEMASRETATEAGHYEEDDDARSTTAAAPDSFDDPTRNFEGNIAINDENTTNTVQTKAESKSDAHSSNDSKEEQQKEQGETSLSLCGVLEKFAAAIILPIATKRVGTALATPVLPILARELGATDAMISVITSLFHAGRTFAEVPASVFAAVRGCRKAVVMSLLVFSVPSILLFGFSRSLWWLVAANFLNGASDAFTFTAVQLLITHLVPKKSRGRLGSFVGASMRWSLVLGPAIGGWCAQHISNRFVFLLQVPLAIALFCVVYCNPTITDYDIKKASERREQQEQLKDQDQQHEHGLWHHFAEIGHHFTKYRRRCIIVGVWGAQLFAMRQCRQLFLPLAALHRGHPPLVVGLVLTASFMVDATLFFVGGYVSDRWGRKAAAVPCCLLMGLSFFAMASLSSSPPPPAAAVSSLTLSPPSLTSPSASAATAAAANSTTSATSVTATASAVTAASASTGSIGFEYDHFDVPLFAVAVLMGLSDSIGAGLVITVQSDNTPKDAVSLLGVFKLLTDVGGFIGTLLAGVLIHMVGFQMCCTVIGFVGLYAALWSFYLI